MEEQIKPTLLSAAKGVSFFSLVETYCMQEKITRIPNKAFHRLCTLMRKMNVKSAVIEGLSPSSEVVKKECFALNTYYQKDIEFLIYKITFISKDIKSIEQVKDLENDSYLSNVILINYNAPKEDETYLGRPPKEGWRTYVYSAIVTIPKIVSHEEYGTLPLLNHYIHINNIFKCEVNISDDDKVDYQIIGTYFCQQNSTTNVCAHAALCMTINNMSEIPGGLICSEDINELIAINHIENKFNHVGQKGEQRIGLKNEEMLSVLKGHGLSYTLKDFFDYPNSAYNEYIYNYIESKCPVLLVFSTDNINHVVPILGHTLSSDMWRPEAETAYSSNKFDSYKSAAAWVDNFIIHDDNFGMCYTLPVDALKRVTLPKHDPSFRARYAVAIIPAGVCTPAWEAEWATVAIIFGMLSKAKKDNKQFDIWTNRLIYDNRFLVVRTFLVKKEDYINSLNEKDFDNNVFSDNDKDQLTSDLPDRFWLSEVTLPELFTANNTKLIDFFYGADYPKSAEGQSDFDKRWIQIRFPHILVKQTDKSKNISMQVKSHYPILEFERDFKVLSW